jgi:SAM-dependent methyltransferase
MEKTIEIKGDGNLSLSDFEKIYHMGLFGSKESRSGTGSTMEQTTHIRAALAQLFEQLGVKTLLDVPCGDFHWMRHVNMPHMHYIGGDIVADMVKKNNEDFGSENVEFRLMDITTDHLPKADIILCRDCIVHLKLEDGVRAIQNFKRSGAKYLLATTFPDHVKNSDDFRYWRTVNLETAPFNLPQPLRIISEKNTEIHLGESYPDKSLGLWQLQDI